MKLQQSPASSGPKLVKKHLSFVVLLVSILLLTMFWVATHETEKLLQNQLLLQGRAFFQEILLTRQWIAQHKGVFVPPEPGETVNPYLLMVPGLKTKIRDESGQEYILKNPALATREISELAQDNALFQFHITSLKPFNPANQPDAFESAALTAFENDRQEYTALTTSPQGQPVFRYMAPLRVQPDCLSCHNIQGYRVGDIRGGISVTISASDAIAQINKTQWLLAGVAAVMWLLIAATIISVGKALITQLTKAESRLLEWATRDALTSLWNRREGHRLISQAIAHSNRQHRPLSLLVMDIDFFKHVNDTYGHSAGDEVLKLVAATIRDALREYDTPCRTGGEEFLVGLPDTDLNQALRIAERLRELIDRTPITLSGSPPCHVTISIGAAVLRPDDSLDTLLARADAAMYLAKQTGRNRVVAEATMPLPQ